MFNLFKKKSKQTVTEIITPNSMNKYKNMYPQNIIVRNNKRNEIEHKRFLLQEKYEEEIRLHYECNNNIERLYKLAIYQEKINNEYAKRCIELCVIDIKLSEKLKDYYLEDIRLQNEAYNFEITDLPYYSSYKRLAQIYEKMKNYSEAIKVCDLAIKNGYIYENNANTVYTRRERLIKKMNKYASTGT